MTEAKRAGDERTLVTVAQGRLRGEAFEHGWRFLGIPYAASPFGELRFREPAPAPAWDGVRDALAYGPTAPKPPYPVPVDALLPEPVIPGLDCLNLNIWTPDPAVTGLPVLVWIHGGAFVNGSGAVSVYRGDRFARDGVVCVTLNYRLGVDGFGLIPDRPANRGLLDQIAALEWVHDNIAAFGGDPEQVTIAGESAGAMSVISLLTMPAAAGLFRGAIAQSGAGHHVLSPPTATKVIAALAERLVIEPTADALAAVPIDRLIDEQAALSLQIQAERDPAKWGEIVVNSMPFEPVVDGDSLPRRPIDAVTDGIGQDVALLTGSNTDEHALFLVPNGYADQVSDDVVRFTLAALRANPDQAITAYHRSGATAGETFIAVLTDWFFRIPAIRLAEARAAHGKDSYLYEFGWRSPALDGKLGACHALEVGFAFDTVDDPALVLTGASAPQPLADEMHRAWVGFVTQGNPGWPAYGKQRTVQYFDEASELRHDPDAATRIVWDGIR
jgi:para-nitrobenzyl esterase